MLRIVLVGNPNSGKSTLFTALTGTSAHIGNWPGVTVEVRRGTCTLKDKPCEIIDLPGCYSLLGANPDEKVAADFLESEQYDVILNVVDSTSLERSLMLTLELTDLQMPMVVALNFLDELQNSGATVDAAKLSTILGVDVVPISAVSGENIPALKEALLRARVPRAVVMDRTIENLIVTSQREEQQTRFAALRAIVNNGSELDEVLNSLDGVHPSEHIIMERYKRSHEIAKQVMTKMPNKWAISDLLDHVLLHPRVGIPGFIVILYLLFKIIFVIGQPLTELTGNAISYAARVLTALLPPGWIKGFVAEALFGGVGNVLSFLPLIFTMFFVVSLLENTGYMARASLIMDRWLSRFGLSGKSFISLILGFGCNVPAVLSTRSIDDPVERKVAAMVIPLIPCSARLPVLTVLGAALFGSKAITVVVFAYAIAVLFSLGLAWLLRSVAFGRMPSFFALELPPYRKPSLRLTSKLAWFRTKDFLNKAFKVVLPLSIVFWLLMNLPVGVPLANSYIALVGRFLSRTVLAPMGLNWEVSSALILGLVAKEAVLSALAQLYGLSGSALVHQISSQLSMASGLAFVTFFVLYVPCAATMGALRREVGSSWMVLQLLLQITVAYLASLAVFQLASLLFR